MSQCGCRPPDLAIFVAVHPFLGTLSACLELVTYEHCSADDPENLSMLSDLTVTHFFPLSSPLYQSDPSSRMAEMALGVAKKESSPMCDSNSVVPAD